MNTIPSTPVKTVPITQELNTIIAEIVEKQNWQQIFNNYCVRTRNPKVIVEHNYGDNFCKASTTWQDQLYHSRPCSNMSEAVDNLFQQLMISVITEEYSEI